MPRHKAIDSVQRGAVKRGSAEGAVQRGSAEVQCRGAFQRGSAEGCSVKGQQKGTVQMQMLLFGLWVMKTWYVISKCFF